MELIVGIFIQALLFVFRKKEEKNEPEEIIPFFMFEEDRLQYQRDHENHQEYDKMEDFHDGI